MSRIAWRVGARWLVSRACAAGYGSADGCAGAIARSPPRAGLVSEGTFVCRSAGRAGVGLCGKCCGHRVGALAVGRGALHLEREMRAWDACDWVCVAGLCVVVL